MLRWNTIPFSKIVNEGEINSPNTESLARHFFIFGASLGNTNPEMVQFIFHIDRQSALASAVVVMLPKCRPTLSDQIFNRSLWDDAPCFSSITYSITNSKWRSFFPILLSMVL